MRGHLKTNDLSPMRKRILIVVLLLTGIASAYVFYLWNKPKREASQEEPIISLTASELFANFQNSEEYANTSLLNQVVEVTGVVSGVDMVGDGVLVVTFETDDPMASVTCTFSPGHAFSKQSGETGTVIGICAGLQGDMLPAVVLSQCSEVNP